MISIDLRLVLSADRNGRDTNVNNTALLISSEVVRRVGVTYEISANGLSCMQISVCCSCGF